MPCQSAQCNTRRGRKATHQAVPSSVLKKPCSLGCPQPNLDAPAWTLAPAHQTLPSCTGGRGRGSTKANEIVQWRPEGRSGREEGACAERWRARQAEVGGEEGKSTGQMPGRCCDGVQRLAVLQGATMAANSAPEGGAARSRAQAEGGQLRSATRHRRAASLVGRAAAVAVDLQHRHEGLQGRREVAARCWGVRRRPEAGKALREVLRPSGATHQHECWAGARLSTAACIPRQSRRTPAPSPCPCWPAPAPKHAGPAPCCPEHPHAEAHLLWHVHLAQRLHPLFARSLHATGRGGAAARFDAAWHRYDVCAQQCKRRRVAVGGKDRFAWHAA